jgi:hypothetical protein
VFGISSASAGRPARPAQGEIDMRFETNVGTVDRALRVGVGAALIGLALAGQIGPWGWVGVLPLLTGVSRFCPAYTLLGVRTCRAG